MMHSLSLRVLELLDENRLSLDETEELLQAISLRSISKHTISKKKDYSNQTRILIPPHFPSYMNGNTKELHN